MTPEEYARRRVYASTTYTKNKEDVDKALPYVQEWAQSIPQEFRQNVKQYDEFRLAAMGDKGIGVNSNLLNAYIQLVHPNIPKGTKPEDTMKAARKFALQNGIMPNAKATDITKLRKAALDADNMGLVDKTGGFKYDLTDPRLSDIAAKNITEQENAYNIRTNKNIKIAQDEINKQVSAYVGTHKSADPDEIYNALVGNIHIDGMNPDEIDVLLAQLLGQSQ
jgi:hypothetical protein